MRRCRHSECDPAYESALMTFAGEAASSPSRRSNVSVSRAQTDALVSRPHDCPSEYDCLFLSKRAACFSARKLFCGTLFAEGGGPSELPRLSRLAFLVSRGGVILFVYQILNAPAAFSGWGTRLFCCLMQLGNVGANPPRLIACELVGKAVRRPGSSSK